MKYKKLQVLFIFVLFGCTPGIEKFYKQLQIPGSGYIYICSLQSVPDELASLQNALNQKPCNRFRTLINSQSGFVYLNSQCMKARGDSVAIAYVKPPNPCPPPPSFDTSYLSSAKYIGFFTRIPCEKVDIYKNGKLILILDKSTYSDLTKTQFFTLPEKLPITTGDILFLMYTIQYHDSEKTMQRKTVQYKEIIK